MVRYIECYNMVMIEKLGKIINKSCNSKVNEAKFQQSVNFDKNNTHTQHISALHIPAERVLLILLYNIIMYYICLVAFQHKRSLTCCQQEKNAKLSHSSVFDQKTAQSWSIFPEKNRKTVPPPTQRQQ